MPAIFPPRSPLALRKPVFGFASGGVRSLAAVRATPLQRAQQAADLPLPYDAPELAPHHREGLALSGGEAEGHFRFDNEAQQAHISQQQGSVKRSGNLLWPPDQVKIIAQSIRGRGLDLATTTALVDDRAAVRKPLVMLDGADELAEVLVSSGLRESTVALLQALLFPLFMAPTHDGYLAAAASVAEIDEGLKALLEARSALWASAISELRMVPAAARVPSDPSLEALASAAPSYARARSWVENTAHPLQGEQRDRVLDRLQQVERVEKALGAQALKLTNARLATVGTAAMYWAMAGYEVAALAQLAKQGALSAAGAQVGAKIIPIAQVMMAFYGMLNTREGLRVAGELRADRVRVRDSALSPAVRGTLEAELSAQLKLNAIGSLFAGPALAAGQLAMIVGGLTGWGGSRTVVGGAAGTISGIAARIGVELLRAARFGYDPSALDFPALQQTVQAQVRAGREPTAAWLEVLGAARTRGLETRAWLGALTAARTGRGSAEAGLGQELAAVARTLEGHPLLARVRGAAPLANAYGALRVLTHVAAAPLDHEVVDRIDAELEAFAPLPASAQLWYLYANLEAAGLAGEVVRATTEFAQVGRNKDEHLAPYFETERVREARALEIPLPRLRRDAAGTRVEGLRVPLPEAQRTVYLLQRERLMAGLAAGEPAAFELAGAFADAAFSALDLLGFQAHSRTQAAQAAMLYVLERQAMSVALQNPSDA